jgi:5'-phosphate synthase pdxT subunit
VTAVPPAAPAGTQVAGAPTPGARAPAVRIPGESLVADRGRRYQPAADGDKPLVGVLALQGDVLEHLRALGDAGAHAVPVKTTAELERLDGLLIPGGESTTIGRLAKLYGLLDPLRERIRAGLPTYGTCAGAILLARTALGDDGQPSPQPLLGVMDTVARRNAFGRQVDSFEADLEVKGIPGAPVHAVFIRAPWIEQAGAGVEILAAVDVPPAGERIVLARQGHILAGSFHPELTPDRRVHELFVGMVRERLPARAHGQSSLWKT